MSKLTITTLNPGVKLLSKLGSAIVHAAEFHETAEPLDLQAFKSIVADPEVEAWLRSMRAMALLPVKRSDR